MIRDLQTNTRVPINGTRIAAQESMESTRWGIAQLDPSTGRQPLKNRVGTPSTSQPKNSHIP